MWRSLVAFLAAVLLTTGPAVAGGSWQHFSSRSLGFAVRYPSDWHATTAAEPDGKQLILQRQGKTPYAMTVFVLNLKSGPTPRQTVRRVVAEQQSIGGPDLRAIKWSATSVGGRSALAGVTRPPTEGGVTVAYGVYIVGWRSYTYEITMAAYGRHAPSTVGQFPTVYRQILASWRFVS